MERARVTRHRAGPVFDQNWGDGRRGWGGGQSSKIANEIAVGGSIIGLSKALVFAEGVALEKRIFLDAVRGWAAESDVLAIFGERILGWDFTPGGFVEYMVKDLGMGLVGGQGKRWREGGVAPYQRLYLGMEGGGDGKMGSQGLITAIERINGKVCGGK